MEDRAEDAVVVGVELVLDRSVARAHGEIEIRADRGVQVRTDGDLVPQVVGDDSPLILQLPGHVVRHLVTSATHVQAVTPPASLGKRRRTRVQQCVEGRGAILGARALRRQAVGAAGVVGRVESTGRGEEWSARAPDDLIGQIVQRIIYSILELSGLGEEVPLGVTAPATLRSNEKHSVGCGRSVQRGCGGPLHDLDGLDVFGVEVVEPRRLLTAHAKGHTGRRGAEDAVDIHQRFVGQRQAVRAPDADPLRASRGAVDVHEDDAGYSSGEEVGDAGDRSGGDL